MDITALSNLLQEKQDPTEHSSPHDKPAFTPGDIGPPKPKPPPPQVPNNKKNKDIWEESEVPEDDLPDDPNDHRRPPR